MLPTATVSFEIVQNMLSFYGGFKSVALMPSLYEINKENPYVLPSNVLKDEMCEDLFAKIFLTLTPSFQMSVEGGILEMRNHRFYYGLLVPQRNIFNAMNIQYANAKKYYMTFETQFNVSQAFSGEVSLTYQDVRRNDDKIATYQPHFIAKSSFSYNWKDKISIKVSPIFKSKQKALFINKEYELNSMFDLNLSATYNHTEKLGFFVDIKNLALQKYSWYYNYPSYQFTVLGGFTLKF
jgi:hypothetical protein